MAKPIVQALLVADHIYEDKLSGKKIIAGIFQNVLRVSQEQRQKLVNDDSTSEQRVLLSGGMEAGSPCAYVSLTEIFGEKNFVLRYVRLNDDQALFQTDFQIRCESPLVTCEVVVPLPKLPTQEAGVFALELICDNEPLGSYRISVSNLKSGENSNENT